MKESGAGGGEPLGTHPVGVERQEFVGAGIGTVDKAYLLIGLRFDAVECRAGQELGNQPVEVLGAGPDYNLRGIRLHAAVAEQIGADCRAEMKYALVFGAREELVREAEQHIADNVGEGRKGEVGR